MANLGLVGRLGRRMAPRVMAARSGLGLAAWLAPAPSALLLRPAAREAAAGPEPAAA